MRSVKTGYMKQALAVAIMTACASFSIQAGEPASIDKDVLVQVMALYGLSEQGAIDRLAAEDAAADLYRRIRSMRLAGYAGAWFDADSGRLHVALSDSAQAELLARFGAVPITATWSLSDLEAVQASVIKEGDLIESGLLRALHVDYAQNRLVVSATPGNVQAVRERLAAYADRIDVRAGGALPELSTDVRGGDGTRNYTFETNPRGHGYYPCSVGAAVENGYYTAGHCGEATNDIWWAAPYAFLGIVQLSAYPSLLDIRGDVGWVATGVGWSPVPKVNGYSDGIINVPAKWTGTNEVPVGSTA